MYTGTCLAPPFQLNHFPKTVLKFYFQLKTQTQQWSQYDSSHKGLSQLNILNIVIKNSAANFLIYISI